MTKVIRALSQVDVAERNGVSDEQIKSEGLVLNRAGGAAYKTSDYNALLSYLTLGQQGGTYYATQSTLEDEANKLFIGFAAREPRFLAQATVYARTEGLMRSVPIRALAYLSTGGSEAKRMFHAIFPRVIQTPDDLQEFYGLLRGEKRVRGIGGAIRTATEAWFKEMSPYHAIKYGAQSQAFSLRDVHRLSHGHYADRQSAQALTRYLVRGELTEDAPAQLRGYDEFKHAEADIETLLALVETHKLPWEVVSGQLGGGDKAEKTRVWTTMAKQMPYMALLRNLRNLLKYGVLDDAAVCAAIIAKLTNEGAVRASKQLPFRFLSAIRAINVYEYGEQQEGSATARAALIEALKRAMDLSVGNLLDNELFANTLVLLDTSGSMSAPINGGNISAQARYSKNPAKPNPVSCEDIASIFAAAAYKVGAERGTSKIAIFNDTARFVENPPKHLGVYDLAQHLCNASGGTNLSSAILLALGDTRSYDNMVFLTDNESWIGNMSGRDDNRYDRKIGETRATALLRHYHERVNPNMHAFFVELAPTETQLVAPDFHNVHFVAGWSDAVLRYMSIARRTGVDQVAAVKEIEL